MFLDNDHVWPPYYIWCTCLISIPTISSYSLIIPHYVIILRMYTMINRILVMDTILHFCVPFRFTNTNHAMIYSHQDYNFISETVHATTKLYLGLEWLVFLWYIHLKVHYRGFRLKKFNYLSFLFVAINTSDIHEQLNWIRNTPLGDRG